MPWDTKFSHSADDLVQSGYICKAKDIQTFHIATISRTARQYQNVCWLKFKEMYMYNIMSYNQKSFSM